MYCIFGREIIEYTVVHIRCTYTVYIYGVHIRCTYTVLASPRYKPEIEFDANLRWSVCCVGHVCEEGGGRV
jgi:hypothetical protein